PEGFTLADAGGGDDLIAVQENRPADVARPARGLRRGDLPSWLTLLLDRCTLPAWRGWGGPSRRFSQPPSLNPAAVGGNPFFIRRGPPSTIAIRDRSKTEFILEIRHVRCRFQRRRTTTRCKGGDFRERNDEIDR